MTPAEALTLADKLHAGQVDKAGRPYIGHLTRVQARLANYPAIFQIAGALHDVKEDQGATRESLAAAGVPEEAIDIIELLTKRPGVTYDTYLQRIASDPRARLVKLADLADNSDPMRLIELPAEQRDYLLKKYRKAVDRLLDAA